MQTMNFFDWLEVVGGCLMDMGINSYDPKLAEKLWLDGYCPPEAAMELDDGRNYLRREQPDE